MNHLLSFVRPAPRRRIQAVRVALDLGYWAVQRLADGRVLSTAQHPTGASARAAVARIAEDEGTVALSDHLPPLLGRGPHPGGHAA